MNILHNVQGLLIGRATQRLPHSGFLILCYMCLSNKLYATCAGTSTYSYMLKDMVHRGQQEEKSILRCRSASAIRKREYFLHKHEAATITITKGYGPLGQLQD